LAISCQLLDESSSPLRFASKAEYRLAKKAYRASAGTASASQAGYLSDAVDVKKQMLSELL